MNLPRTMLVFRFIPEYNEIRGSLERHDEDLFQEQSEKVPPSWEIRLDTKFPDLVKLLEKNYAKIEGIQGACKIKKIGEQEHYLQPCGNEIFMKAVRAAAEALNLRIVE